MRQKKNLKKLWEEAQFNDIDNINDDIFFVDNKSEQYQRKMAKKLLSTDKRAYKQDGDDNIYPIRGGIVGI